MARDIAAAVSRAGTATVAGHFQRHVSPRQEPLRGSRAGGRWGPEGAYPVLYLGRPTDSVIVEAYRHLVETVEGMQPQMVGPRRLVTCEVEITSVLDLRESASHDAVGLTIADLCSEVGDYEACHHIGKAAYQLGLHGIIAPAASGLGETLAIFEDQLLEERAASPGRRADLGLASGRPALSQTPCDQSSTPASIASDPNWTSIDRVPPKQRTIAEVLGSSPGRRLTSAQLGQWPFLHLKDRHTLATSSGINLSFFRGASGIIPAARIASANAPKCLYMTPRPGRPLIALHSADLGGRPKWSRKRCMAPMTWKLLQLSPTPGGASRLASSSDLGVTERHGLAFSKGASPADSKSSSTDATRALPRFVSTIRNRASL